MNDKQRAMMAAHLCERTGRELSEGRCLDAWRMIEAASTMRRSGTPEADYRGGLWACGVERAERDAAVASIQRGEWPADSLAGRVLKMRDDASRDFGIEADEAQAHRLEGASYALTAVLALLGVKP